MGCSTSSSLHEVPGNHDEAKTKKPRQRKPLIPTSHRLAARRQCCKASRCAPPDHQSKHPASNAPTSAHAATVIGPSAGILGPTLLRPIQEAVETIAEASKGAATDTQTDTKTSAYIAEYPGDWPDDSSQPDDHSPLDLISDTAQSHGTCERRDVYAVFDDAEAGQSLSGEDVEKKAVATSMPTHALVSACCPGIRCESIDEVCLCTKKSMPGVADLTSQLWPLRDCDRSL